jgi:hypothetical protein
MSSKPIGSHGPHMPRMGGTLVLPWTPTGGIAFGCGIAEQLASATQLLGFSPR